MLTIKLKIKEMSDTSFVENKQKDYTYAFRKMYKNINDINPDYIKQEFNLNLTEYHSCLSDAKTKNKQTNTFKEKEEERIVNIEETIKELKEKDKLTKKETRKLFKLNNKLNHKIMQLSKDIVFGGSYNLKKISYLSNTEDKETLDKYKKEYKDNRLLPLYILGEANQRGNRFFTFDLKNNKVIYKPNRETKIQIDLIKYKNYVSILDKLQEYTDNKLIPVSVRLDTKYIYLMFDEEKLNGYSINEVERTIEIKGVKSRSLDKETEKQCIKEVYKEYYREQEDRKLEGKLSYRYMGIDTNPDYIGVSILDKISDDEYKVVYTFCYDLSELNKRENHTKNNKRKHILYHLWKDLFNVFKYFNCSYLVVEDLNIKEDNLGNREGNRKVKNLWYRELSIKAIDKYCNTSGIIKVEVNPCYSSFIGNVLHEYIDPINASIEICRRGMYKYEKNKFYPKVDIGTILNAMSRLNEESRDVLDIKDEDTWIELYRKIRESGLRYRATMNDNENYQVVFNIGKDNLKKLVFH